jgi:hypothetical protein
MHATIFGFELVERCGAHAMPAANLCRRHSSFLFFHHPHYLGFGKTALSHLSLFRKVEQTLHSSEGSFGGQVTSPNHCKLSKFQVDFNMLNTHHRNLIWAVGIQDLVGLFQNCFWRKMPEPDLSEI